MYLILRNPSNVTGREFTGGSEIQTPRQTVVNIKENCSIACLEQQNCYVFRVAVLDPREHFVKTKTRTLNISRGEKPPYWTGLRGSRILTITIKEIMRKYNNWVPTYLIACYTVDKTVNKTKQSFV